MRHASPAREILRFIRNYSRTPAPEAAFNALALSLFRFQFEHNAFYRRFCVVEGVSSATVKDWKQIPAMPARAFKELVLTTFPARQKKKVFKTSGTTLGSTGAHFFRTLELYEASLAPAFREGLLWDGAALSYHFLIAPASEAPHSSLSWMMGVVNRRFARGRGRFYIRAGRPRFEALARDLKKQRKKTLLLATAFTLKAFLGYLESAKIRLTLPSGSRLMETGGFKGRTKEISKEALYGLCGRRLGIPRTHCVSEYGMTELSSQYYSRSLGPFRGAAWLRAVVVDPRNGRECRSGAIGILKHVDLANLGSVMAVQTEDLGRASRGGPSTGSGQAFELLGRASGSEARGCSLSYERFLGGTL